MTTATDGLSSDAAPDDSAAVSDPNGPNGTPDVAGSDITGVVERCIWSIVWLGVIGGGFALWGSWSQWAYGGVVAPLLVAAGIVGLVATWLVTGSRSPVIQLSGLAVVIISMLCNQGLGIHTRRYYSTDSAAFNQVGAWILIHGKDPYAATLGSAGKLLRAPSQFWTYTVGGGHVDHVSYPAGSFLMQIPALALGFHHEVVDWLDLFAWVVTVVLLFFLLPVSLRWVPPLLVLAPLFSGVFASGGTDAAYLPFLVLALWRWDRFGLEKSTGVARWLGPVALGLACSIKQTPWFCVPFILIGLLLEARPSGRRPLRLVTRYLAVVVGIFAVINLPFVIWQPSAWVHGTLLPFSQPLVADGQGLVTLALHGVAHGVSLRLLAVAGVLVLIAELAAMVIWYPQMKRIWILFLPLAFFVATRSLSTYLVDLYPAAIVALVSVAPAPGRAPAVARGRGPLRFPYGLAAIVPAVAAVGVSVLAFVSPPLQLAVRSVVTSKGPSILDAVTINVHNVTGQTITPHFMVQANDGNPDGFWLPLHGGPVVVGPHASSTVTLQPQQPFGTPGRGSEWLVEAYTTSPEALSTSPLMFWAHGDGPPTYHHGLHRLHS
jgi:hypothetical protein